MPSRECQAIIDFVAAQGIPYKVTDINTPKVHAEHSYHYWDGTGGKGLAVDFAGTTPNDEPQMAAIYAALFPLAAHFKELIHNGDMTGRAVRNGVVANGITLFGPVVWAAHRNHVHVAVAKGTFLTDYLPKQPVKVEVKPVWDPPLQVVDFLPYWKGSGGWMLFADGGVGAVGEAPQREGQQPLGQPYWQGKKPARLERNGEGYTVVSTDNGRYDYP